MALIASKFSEFGKHPTPTGKSKRHDTRKDKSARGRVQFAVGGQTFLLCIHLENVRFIRVQSSHFHGPNISYAGTFADEYLNVYHVAKAW